MKVTGPLFKWFGSKWLSSKTLPAPTHEAVIEPFAGGAGYSLRYCERNIVLSETDPHISELWKWLINGATPALIREIPVGVPVGTDIRTLGLSPGQSLLLKSWQRTNNVGNCWTISPWGNKPGQWTENTRARVSEEVGVVKRWTFVEGGALETMMSNRRGTWFIDPPYQYNYGYKQPPIGDYNHFANVVHELKGQIIACEAVCPETGLTPSYLPFQPWKSRITSRRKTGNNVHSKEMLWERP